MTETKEKPKFYGVVAIITGPTGHVIATAVDCERQAPGGFKLWEGQLHRVRDTVKRAAVRAYCSDVMWKALSSYSYELIARDLLSQEGGHRLTLKSIGYADDIAQEIERR